MRRVCLLLTATLVAILLPGGTATARVVDCAEIPETDRWSDAGTPDVGQADMTIAAHRGAAELAPENTLDAYRYAIAYGVDMIEVDVQQTVDHRFVSFHDTTVEAKTNGTGPIAAMTYDQVRALNAADNAKWKGTEYDPAQIPSLEEVLTLARDTGTGIYFDIKESVTDPGGVALMAKDFGVVADSAFLTYDPARAAVVRDVLPNADIMLSNQGFTPHILYAIGADYTWFGSSMPLYTAEHVVAVHDACGLVIPNVYQGDVTGTEAGDLLHARAIGADGAQINNPDVVAEALNEPVATKIEFARRGTSRLACLVDADHGLGLPLKELAFPGGSVTTGRGGCAVLSASFRDQTIGFAGDGSALSSQRSPQESRSDLEHYIGALHAHSGYSDGWPGARPETYFASAKGFDLDFLGSSEHSENADLPITLSEECLSPMTAASCLGSDKKEPSAGVRTWEETRDQAQAATDGDFTAFRGFEWSSDRFGHINVYFSENITSAYRDGGFAALETFWNWFSLAPSQGGGADGLATFNHPGDKKLQASDPGYNWNSFRYVPAADQRMVGIEVYNGDKDYVSSPRGDFYSQALDAGWHVGAIGAEDLGHDRPEAGSSCPPDDAPASEKCWGHERWAKTVFVAETNSADDLREAMAARRMYAVLDRDVRIDVSAAGEQMGSRLSRPTGGSVPITVSATDDITRVDLLSNGGEVVATAPGSVLSFDAPVTADERWYFARVWGERRGETVPLGYTSPVWIEGGGSLLPVDLQIDAPSTVAYSDEIEISGTLTSDGEPLASREVLFRFGDRSVTARTDAFGIARARFPVTNVPGTYGSTASTLSDHTYAAAADERSVSVVRESTVLRNTGDRRTAASGVTKLRALLTDDEGVPVAGKRIQFAAGPDRTWVATTNANGIAAIDVIATKVNAATRAIFRNGDPLYLPTQSSN